MTRQQFQNLLEIRFEYVRNIAHLDKDLLNNSDLELIRFFFNFIC